MSGKYISQDELGHILENAPPGTDENKLVKGLMSEGFDLEGFGQHAIAHAEAKPQFVDTESFAGNPVFEAIGKVGKYAAEKVGTETDYLAEKAGQYLPGPIAKGVALNLTIPAVAAKLMLPQDADSAGMMGMLPGMENTGQTKQLMLAERPSVVKPGPLSKTVGQGLSATTAIPERYTKAVVADTFSENPTILNTTDTPQSLSKEYTKVFENLGMKFDSEFVKKVTNKRYIPNENQASQGYNVIDELLTKMEGQEPGKLPANEAFLGRSIAASLKRSNQYATNKTFKSVVDGAQTAFDGELEAQGIPEFKDLGVRYFKAVAKEHFNSWLPQNKNMSANALRSLLALRLGVKGVANLATGNLPGAALNAAEAAAMSPKLVGLALKGAGKAVVGPNITPNAVNSSLWLSLMAKNKNGKVQP